MGLGLLFSEDWFCIQMLRSAPAVANQLRVLSRTSRAVTLAAITSNIPPVIVYHYYAKIWKYNNDINHLRFQVGLQHLAGFLSNSYRDPEQSERCRERCVRLYRVQGRNIISRSGTLYLVVGLMVIEAGDLHAYVSIRSNYNIITISPRQDMYSIEGSRFGYCLIGEKYSKYDIIRICNILLSLVGSNDILHRCRRELYMAADPYNPSMRGRPMLGYIATSIGAVSVAKWV